MRRALPLIFILSAISFLITDGRIIRPQAAQKYELQQRILSGTEETPMQYSILAPSVSFALQKMIAVGFSNNQKIRLYSFRILGFILFAVFFFVLYQMLRISFDQTQTFIGLTLAQVLLAYILQDHYTEPAMLNLIFFTMGMLILLLKKDQLLPLIVALGTINEPQIIAIVALYMLYNFGEKKLFSIKSIAVILISVILWVFIESVLRSFYGIRITSQSPALQITNLPLLIAALIILISLSLKSLSSTDYIFRMSLFFIPLYLLITLMLMPEAGWLEFSPAIIFLIPPILSNFGSKKWKYTSGVQAGS